MSNRRSDETLERPVWAATGPVPTPLAVPLLAALCVGLATAGLLLVFAHRMPLTSASGAQLFAWQARYLPGASLAYLAGVVWPVRWRRGLGRLAVTTVLVAVPSALVQRFSVDPHDLNGSWLGTWAGGAGSRRGDLLFARVVVGGAFAAGCATRWCATRLVSQG